MYSEDLISIEDPVIIPYFTAVILLDNGNVTDFQWDEGCDGICNPNTQCIDDVCGNQRFNRHGDICGSDVKFDCTIKVHCAAKCVAKYTVT